MQLFRNQLFRKYRTGGTQNFISINPAKKIYIYWDSF